MRGFQKEKNRKKVARSTKAAKKLRFLFKTCFSNKNFFVGVTGNILEEDVDLIVAGDLIVTKL